MKKILYIGNNRATSNPTTLVQLSAQLTATGFEVVIYSQKKNKLLRVLHMCMGVLQHNNADYILIDTYSTLNFQYAFIISQLARFMGIRYIPILHGGNLPKRLKESPKQSRAIFKHSCVNVAPSNYLLSIFKENNFKVIFIPNSIELKKYAFKERSHIQPKLLWVRAFDAIYNPLLAIEVLTLLKLKYSNVSLCMVGPDKDGSLHKVLQLAKQNRVLEALEITGQLSKEAWIEKSKDFDVFINTTTIDNMPVSVIEAMALGLPVVSTNVGGMPHLIETDKNGILVENNNAVEMLEAIVELIENSTKVVEIAANARKTVNEFDVEFVKQQWVNVLK